MSPAKRRQRDSRLRSLLAVFFSAVLSILLFLDVFIPGYDTSPLIAGVVGGMVLALVGINVIQNAVGTANFIARDDEEDDAK